MRWDARYTVVLTALALGALTVWSLRYFARYQPFAGLDQSGERPGPIGVQIQGATVVGRDHGRRRWRAACRTLTFSRDWRQVRVDGIRQGVLYDASGRPSVRVQAGRAVYETPVGVLGDANTPLGLLRLDGGVRATFARRPGFALLGTGLVWDAAADRVRCLGPVTARYPGGSATAEDVAVDARSGVLTLHRLRGTLTVPPEAL